MLHVGLRGQNRVEVIAGTTRGLAMEHGVDVVRPYLKGLHAGGCLREGRQQGQGNRGFAHAAALPRNHQAARNRCTHRR